MTTIKMLICSLCNKNFKRNQKYLYKEAKDRFCSKECKKQFYSKTKLVKCLNCYVSFEKKNHELIRNPNSFCSSSCSASYNNKNKKYGVRRSKLEAWLESKLTKTYSNLDIHFNRKDTINSELDIHIPKLKLAFELNGIFHYKPVFGIEKLNKIQENDQKKFLQCFNKGITLYSIDTSLQKRFSKKSSEKYLKMIIDIIEQNLSQQQ